MQMSDGWKTFFLGISLGATAALAYCHGTHKQCECKDNVCCPAPAPAPAPVKPVGAEPPP